MAFKKLVLICGVAFMASAGMRFLEALRWDPAIHMLDGEYLLATHDAYAWVAGAERASARTFDFPMSRMLAMLAALTPISSSNLAYWLPPLLAGLSAIPVVFWALHLGASPFASFAAGVFGSLAPAFFARTRVGYFDTDWATLFFPLLIGLLMAAWLELRLQNNSADAGSPASSSCIIRRPLLLLFVIPIGLVWHDFIRTYALSILWLALILTALMVKRSSRTETVLALLAITLATGAGWAGAAAGVLLVLFQDKLSRKLFNNKARERVASISLLFILVLFTGIQFREYLSGKLAQYAGISSGSSAALVYPDLNASVREVQSAGVLAAFEGAAYLWWLGLLGLVGSAVIMVRKPHSVFLLPLLILGVLSPRIGARFSMYASPVLILGIVVPLDRSIRILLISRGKWGYRLNALILGAFVVLIVLVQRAYARLPIETVLGREHAGALRELASSVDSEGLVWTWWDYGYATQYFTGFPTFADGGRNSGEYLFALGSVLGSGDLRSSANLMAYSATHDDAPWRSWESLDSAGLASWFQTVEEAGNIIAAGDPQYLIVQWEAISFLPWIQYFGGWDFEAAQGQRSHVEHFLHPLELDLEQGIFIERQGRTYGLKSADLLDVAGTRHYDFPANEDGPHLLIHMETSEVYLLDHQSYNSTLVQLLILPSDHSSLAGLFDALIDAGPDAKVFRLR